jgi:CTP synthase (UTP-ammonia lyase)
LKQRVATYPRLYLAFPAVGVFTLKTRMAMSLLLGLLIRYNRMAIRIALIGDHQPEVAAHITIPKALKLATVQPGTTITFDWLASATLMPQDINKYNGVWGVPYSPYRNMDNILNAIQHPRTKAIPYLGTCAGYQHAVLEFARNQLGLQDADNTEVNESTRCPLISSLYCGLVEVSDHIFLQADSKISTLYGETDIEEGYHCSYGVNRGHLDIFSHSDMRFAGFDKGQDPRVFELNNHPFFLGTAYQPERSTLSGDTHPLITAFAIAA